MTSIDTFSKIKNRDAVRNDITNAIQEVCHKHGVRLSPMDVRYNATTLTIKFDVTTANAISVQEHKQDQEWNYLEAVYPALAGAIYTRNSKTFRVVGYNPDRPKNSIIMEEFATKKRYKTTVADAYLGCGLPLPAPKDLI